MLHVEYVHDGGPLGKKQTLNYSSINANYLCPYIHGVKLGHMKNADLSFTLDKNEIDIFFYKNCRLPR